MDDYVTHILWDAAGRPPMDGDCGDICRVCGQRAGGLPFSDWVRPTFTDWDKLLPGNILCQACQFSFAEKSELLTQRIGKEKLQRMRNYSHFVVGGEWLPLSKSAKAQMIHVLLHEDWQVAVVAQSGQKHLVFRARPGIVQFEEQQIPDLCGLGDLLATVELLYSNFSKAEIETGDYAQHRVMKFGPSPWWELESVLRPQRQTVLFELALFLAQKKEVDNGRTERVAQSGSGATGRDMAEYPRQLQIPL